MIRRIIVAVFSAWLLISCAEDEVVPRTNPRFSVALIQGVDQTGAEFSANIYDYGSEEILEYGFVYGDVAQLGNINSEIISAKGNPPMEFKLRAIHGLAKGKSYQVAAFLKTESGVVYSESRQFVADGSIGFILSQIIAPSEVFFGDELIFQGENLPRNPASIRGKFEGVEMKVTQVEGGQFKAEIPQMFVFDPERAVEGRFLITILVGAKTLEVEKVLNFRKPTFQVSSAPEIAYDELIQIRGRDLQDAGVAVSYTDNTGKKTKLDLASSTDELIEVSLNALFTEGKPKLTVSIRGIAYELANVFSLKPTTITAGQGEEYDGWYRYLEIHGENFNPISPDFNRLVLEGVVSHYTEITEATSTKLRVTLTPGAGVYSRQISIRSEMGPGKSEHGYLLKVTTPELPVEELPYGLFGLSHALGVSYQGKGYLIAGEGIYEYSASDFFPKKIHGQIQVPYFSFSRLAFATGGEGSLFVSDGEVLFSFDLASRQVRLHPDLPNIAAENLGFFVEGGYLYVEYGNLSGWGFTPTCKRRFRMNLALNVWEELEAESRDRYYISNKPFRVNGVLYSYRIVTEQSGNSSEIVRFNPATKNWDLVKVLSSDYIEVWTNEVYVIGDLVYFPANANSFVLDSKTWEARFIDNFFFGTRPREGAQIGSYFYQFKSNADHFYLYQIDPSYFVLSRRE
ncbi:hypothetical protein J0A67_01550 [Algoriphagus aestuariicola]|jgi:hypothetical protein|uniref:IPT/TIG domain-containing protein n=1 Tax=Algoriphagus aestuariicola TaxID=1852016 RepID=A0ABS3BKK0_9BACT|nr:hypothetical protein [Algoriphagus aestuariicola]MBN7799522.1 hypothetical protein [Algoriphagus aestuariicola]